MTIVPKLYHALQTKLLTIGTVAFCKYRAVVVEIAERHNEHEQGQRQKFTQGNVKKLSRIKARFSKKYRPISYS